MKKKKNNGMLKTKGIQPTTKVKSNQKESKSALVPKNDYPNDIQGLFNQLGI